MYINYRAAQLLVSELLFARRRDVGLHNPVPERVGPTGRSGRDFKGSDQGTRGEGGPALS